MIRFSKKIEEMEDVEFLKEALKEIQKAQKVKGNKFKYDIDSRNKKIKAKKKD